MNPESHSIDTFKRKKVLITGGLGFIGSNLARRLEKMGANITLIDSLIPQYGGNYFNARDLQGRVHINICDVRDPFAMAHLVKGADFLFNLAGQTSHADSMTDPRADLDINASAQLSILEACRHENRGIKIIFASTRQIYGRPDYLPVDEDHPLRPTDVNGINKLAGESYHLLYNRVHGIRACALRLTNTYGPGMRVKDARQTFLGIWIRNLVEGKPFEIFGDGKQLRDFNYVEDCVDALITAASDERCNGQIFNLGGAEVVSLHQLAELLTNLGVEGSFTVVQFPPDRKQIDIGDYYGDYSRFTKLTGWKPKTSLRQGLINTIQYYLKYAAHYQ